jgi:hypothetical protein
MGEGRFYPNAAIPSRTHPLNTVIPPKGGTHAVMGRAS